MLNREQSEFFFTDGSVNTKRAIEAGKDERTKAILDGFIWSAKLLRVAYDLAGQVVRASIRA